MMTDLSVTVTRVIAAPAATLFDAWFDPVKMAQFIRPMAGMDAPNVTNDPVEGGQFKIVMNTPNGALPHTGTYKEISPHSRLVFTWETSFSAEGSTVTLDFKEVDSGTEVTLTHVKFPSEESRDNHSAGWGQILDSLQAVES